MLDMNYHKGNMYIQPCIRLNYITQCMYCRENGNTYTNYKLNIHHSNHHNRQHMKYHKDNMSLNHNLSIRYHNIKMYKFIMMSDNNYLKKFNNMMNNLYPNYQYMFNMSYDIRCMYRMNLRIRVNHMIKYIGVWRYDNKDWNLTNRKLNIHHSYHHNRQHMKNHMDNMYLSTNISEFHIHSYMYQNHNHRDKIVQILDMIDNCYLIQQNMLHM